MFLDTVNPDILTTDRKVLPTATAEAPFAAWEHFPHSYISHHGSTCCELAREWFLAMDYSQMAGGSALTGPRWIRARYEWGPSAHPIHWCEAVKRKILDCGALAALAHECFLTRGVRSFPAQFIQRYSADATAHWKGKWQSEAVSPHWLHDDLIYHEGCAVLLPDGPLRLWDASAAWWLNPAGGDGYGSVAAVKIYSGGPAPGGNFTWGEHRILPDTWMALQAG